MEDDDDSGFGSDLVIDEDMEDIEDRTETEFDESELKGSIENESETKQEDQVQACFKFSFNSQNVPVLEQVSFLNLEGKTLLWRAGEFQLSL